MGLAETSRSLADIEVAQHLPAVDLDVKWSGEQRFVIGLGEPEPHGVEALFNGDVVREIPAAATAR